MGIADRWNMDKKMYIRAIKDAAYQIGQCGSAFGRDLLLDKIRVWKRRLAIMNEKTNRYERFL